MEEEVKHTPGPWGHSESFPYSDSFHIQTVDRTHRNTFIGDVGGGLQSKSEKQANARLISAAPDMYEALKKIIEMNRQTAEDKYGDAEKAEDWSCVTVARSALLKAEGKTQNS